MAGLASSPPPTHLDLVVGLDAFVQAHLLLQVEAEFFQAAKDAVVVRCLSALVLAAAVCEGRRRGGVIDSDP